MKYLIKITFLLLVTINANSQDFSQAKKLYVQGKSDEALAIFTKVKKGTAEFPESRYYAGLIYLQQKDFSKAEEHIKQAIAVNNDVAKYHLAMVSLYGQQVMKANVFRQASMASSMRTHMEEAVRLNPYDMNTPVMLAGFYMQAPSIMGGGQDKAIDLANKVSKISKADGHRIFGLIAQVQKKFPEAEENYQKAISIAPDSVKYYYSLAQIYQAQQQFDKMIEVYDKAITKFPTNKNILLNAGRALANSNDKYWDKALPYLNNFIASKHDKNDKLIGEAYYYMGIIAKNKNNNQLARNYFNSALKINPNHAQAQEAIKNLN